jgi:hypothetical protein
MGKWERERREGEGERDERDGRQQGKGEGIGSPTETAESTSNETDGECMPRCRMCCQAVRAAPMMYAVADMRSRLIWIVQACIVVPCSFFFFSLGSGDLGS